MTLYAKLLTASSMALAIGLTACGGGSAGSGPGLVMTPAPAASTPPPPPPPLLNGSAVGLTQQRDFTALGISGRFNVGPLAAWEDLAPDPPGAVQFRYLEADQSYEAVLPGMVPGRLEITANDRAVNYSGAVVRNGNTPGTRQADLELFRPGASNGELPLTYTSFGSWVSGNRSEPGPQTGGYFAYGVPTAPGDVPTRGTGTYDALVKGRAADIGWPIEGEAQLTFDFGAGTLTGHMEPIYATWDVTFDLGRYDLTQTVYAVGSPNFSGKFIVPGGGPAADSFFDGQFTGPQAAELMARWLAPYLNPETNQWSTMFGIWVGKKH